MSAPNPSGPNWQNIHEAYAYPARSQYLANQYEASQLRDFGSVLNLAEELAAGDRAAPDWDNRKNQLAQRLQDFVDQDDTWALLLQSASRRINNAANPDRQLPDIGRNGPASQALEDNASRRATNEAEVRRSGRVARLGGWILARNRYGHEVAIQQRTKLELERLDGYQRYYADRDLYDQISEARTPGNDLAKKAEAFSEILDTMPWFDPNTGHNRHEDLESDVYSALSDWRSSPGLNNTAAEHQAAEVLATAYQELTWLDTKISTLRTNDPAWQLATEQRAQLLDTVYRSRYRVEQLRIERDTLNGVIPGLHYHFDKGIEMDDAVLYPDGSFTPSAGKYAGTRLNQDGSRWRKDQPEHHVFVLNIPDDATLMNMSDTAVFSMWDNNLPDWFLDQTTDSNQQFQRLAEEAYLRAESLIDDNDDASKRFANIKAYWASFTKVHHTQTGRPQPDQTRTLQTGAVLDLTSIYVSAAEPEVQGYWILHANGAKDLVDINMQTGRRTVLRRFHPDNTEY